MTYAAGLFALLHSTAGAELYAQNTPYFDMVLYFEDAVGNRDSVSFGYDQDASSNLDIEWGEEEITTPFGAIFEVRIAEPTINAEKLSKRIIGGAVPFVGSQCLDGRTFFIYIHAINQPVKVWWDNTALNTNECFVSGWIIDNIRHHLAVVSVDEFSPTYYCLGAVDSAYFSLADTMGQFDPPRIFIEKEVEGIGLKPIPGLEVAVMPLGAYSPCYWVETGTEEKFGITGEISVFPNPADTWIKLILDNQKLEELRLFNQKGQLIKVVFGDSMASKNIDVSELPNGSYFLQVKIKDNRYYAGRFVKQ